jgi:hypothetical protein
MLSKLLAIGFETGDGISLADFFDRLSSLKDSEIPFGEYKRLVYVGEDGEYHTGLFLTIKNYRRFCELKKNDQGKFHIEVREVATGNSAVDFNFFIIHKDSGRGLYQRHYYSCAVGRFFKFCREHYNDLRDDRINRAIDDLGERPKQSAIRDVRRQFKGGLQTSTQASGGKVKEMLEELKRIRQLEFTVTELSVAEPWATPLSGFVTGYTRRVTLAPGPIAQIRAAVTKSIDDGHLENGRIRGDDSDDTPRIIQLAENADVFGEYDFNDVAAAMAFDLSDLSQSAFLSEMLKKARDNRAYFETRTV